MSGAIGTRPIGTTAIGSSGFGVQPRYVGSGAIGTYPIGGASIGGTVAPCLTSPYGQSLGGEWLIINRRRHRR